ncbi:MAG: MBOAT family protein [Clostridia bacterium]|nr:MBOAT family protein [Clostridia bacterium]
MIFASLLFLYIFLPLNLILYFIFPDLKVKNIVLIAFSLLFYAWGEPVWVFLLILTAYLDYRHGLTMEKYRGTPKAKTALILSILTDVGIFVVFKYSGFFMQNINALTGLSLYEPEFTLPVGISFYTFQTLTYTIDVYRGKITAQPKFSKYILYLTLYFQLVAGPIVRYTDVQKEIEHRKLSIPAFSSGVYRFAVGLGKKVIIANAAGVFVDKYMTSSAASLTTLGAWFGIMMYTIQLYYDFSGYSDMAIGLGKMFGFDFPENFNYPYISKSVSEFWRRWHMTLGSFFRDYVYIPLGGNRHLVYRNLLIVWFLTGFWHGASWNFVIWGLYNGLFIMLERIFKDKFEKIPRIIQHLYLLVVVMVGFVFFKFESLSVAIDYIKVMFTGGVSFTSFDLNTELINNLFWIIIAIILCMPVMKHLENIYNRTVRVNTTICVIYDCARLALICALIIFSTAHLAGNSFNPFLYNAF